MMMHARSLSLSYDQELVLKNIDVNLMEGSITSIIGPNGSGKATLLKSLSRCLKPKEGDILYQGKPLQDYRTRELAKNIALLPQTPQIPMDDTVYDLVCRGRFPHTNWMGQLDKQDKHVVQWAIEATQLQNLMHREISTLSGGERQRAFIAMSLAQEPRLLFLDEPTAHLDIAHQFEILELIKELNRDMKIDIVMVLHDLNQAMQYADNLLVVCQKGIYAHGKTGDVMCEQLCEEVFGIEVRFVMDRNSEQRWIVPVGAKELVPCAV